MKDALTILGCNVIPFKWHSYFIAKSRGTNTPGFWAKIQRKLSLGPLINKINADLIQLAIETQPHVIFIYRGEHIYGSTIQALKAGCPRAFIIGYNNDDPFSPRYPKWFWRHFIESIPFYDLVLSYRQRNIPEYINAGAKHVELMRSWYVPSVQYSLDIEKEYDVVFVGHGEDDGRLQALEKIVESGFSLGLFGPSHYWSKQLKKSPHLAELLPVTPVLGSAYNKVLNEAKVALCFFSTLNRDTYTRRCFEIPAAGTVLLAQYSDDLAGLFEPDVEAVYFKSPDELITKLTWLLENNDIRTTIAKAGQQKAVTAGHDVVSRMKLLLQWIDLLSNNTLQVISAVK